MSTVKGLKKQPLSRVRHLVYWPLSYAVRAIIERFFAAAKRSYGLDTCYHIGWDAVLLQVTLTFCVILAGAGTMSATVTAK